MRESTNTHIPQVASSSPLKKRVGMMLFALIILGLLLFVWHSQKKSSYAPTSSTTKSYLNTLQMDPPQEVKTPLTQLHETIDLEKLAQAEKFYRLRQNAPIEMYQSTHPYAVNMEAPTSNVSPNNPLPLTSHQIEALKNSHLDSNSHAERLSHTSTIRAQAQKLSHPEFTVAQGTLISGVLQTAINSDLPGMVKANVSHDVYAMQGARVLIPKGSTLIGEYNSGISLGQRRIFIVWTRLIRPDGIDVPLNSPGTDAIGQAGLNADALTTHFWSRFGQAALLSIASNGLGGAHTDNLNTADSYRLALANSFQQTANNSLLNTMNIKPTLHIHQGDAISVFVNRDLSFYEVLSRRENS
jgi:type IV secretory pathway VirB10-like protein